MKKIGAILALVCATSLAARGQVTNVQKVATNSIRLDWEARSGTPYYILATTNLVKSAWSNLTPAGVVFSNAQGTYVLPMNAQKQFYCITNGQAILSGVYIVIDLSAGPEASSYPVTSLNDLPPGGWSDEYKTTKLVLRRIPAATFTMGSPTNELGRESDEQPHAVTLTKDFYIGVFEVTQKQWERVMGTWPGYFNNVTYRESRPVEQVGYFDIRGSVAGAGWPANSNVDADSFMGKLRARTGIAFDLPTESQWEYAGRAGTTTALNSGYNLTNASADAHMAEVGRYAQNGGLGGLPNSSTNSGTAKVGSYLPNAWGLYDMHGNVWEWCLDWYGSYPGTVSDPTGAASGSTRVRRGGSWNTFNAATCRSANRDSYDPASRDIWLGFRPVNTLP